MSKIKLNAASGGSVALKPPTQTTSSADVELTLPINDGDNGQILQTNGSGALSWATPAVANTNSLQVLEKFYLLADGRSVSTANGTVTTTSASSQAHTDVFAIVAGSQLTYQPPTGTTEVIYEFKTVVSETGANNRLLYSWYLTIDGTMINESRETYMNAASGYVHELAVKHGFRVNTGGSDSSVTGDRAGLPSMEFKVLSRRWNSTYASTMNYITYHGGTSTANITKRPYVGITAIGSVS